MAFLEKLSTDVATKTHGVKEAGVMDLLHPTAPLIGVAAGARTALYTGLGWFGRGWVAGDGISLMPKKRVSQNSDSF